MTTYPCGCVNDPNHRGGVMRNVSKCAEHIAAYRSPESLDAAYFRELGLLDKSNQLKPTAHVAELTAALGELPNGNGSPALEIGCGVSPYAKMIRDRGYRYLGIEPSRYAANFMRALRFPVSSNPWPLYVHYGVGLVLAAHSLEHMPDAVDAVGAMFRALAPGGRLILVVPDDSDPVNPDHLYFFTEQSLLGLLERTGFVIEKSAVRRIVPRENFIYVRARKP